MNPEADRACSHATPVYVPTKLQIPDQITNPHAQGVSDDFKRPQGHALLAVLQPVEMRSVQAC